MIKMLPQVSTEALYSATFVENYLDCVENLPDDLQRLLSRMRELDVTYRAYLREVEQQTEWLGSTDIESTSKKVKALARIQSALIAAQELGDEKLNVVQNLLDLIENKTRQLDLDYRNLDYGKDEPSSETKEQQPPINTVSNQNVVANSGERQSKRARRTRHDTFSGLDSNLNETIAATEHVLRSAVSQNVTTSAHTQKKSNTGGSGGGGGGGGGTSKKKKRKSRGTSAAAAAAAAAQVAQQQRDESPPREEETPIDPDEPTYCLCDQISYGEMIMCDNDLCPIEWFHFSCVSLTIKPKGKWFCPKCRGDRPNIMKPKAQFLRELEKYNKEKEEKT